MNSLHLQPSPAESLPKAVDQHGRVIDYLRISITDQCNERCLYCRPAEFKGWVPREGHLSTEELIRVIETCHEAGFRAFRLTGGEPLLRPDVETIVAAIHRLPRVRRIALSTNGTRLAGRAEGLKKAGLQSVNISLDSLDPAGYRELTGGRLDDALEGIDAALQAGFRLKLNAVLLRGINETQWWPLIEFAAARGVPIRFIELMPLTLTDEKGRDRFVGVQEALERLRERYPVEPLPAGPQGDGPARYFRVRGLDATVGFIGALTETDFCERCNKIRLTADGKFRPCLGRHGEVDLAEALTDPSGRKLREALAQTLEEKPRDHEFGAGYEPGRPMIALGG